MTIIRAVQGRAGEPLADVRAGMQVAGSAVPVARLLGLTTTATLERLTAAGVIGRPAAPRRPQASGRPRPRPRRPVADLVSDQRR